MGVNAALTQRVARTYWLRTSFVLQRPTRTQTASGEWVNSWTTIYPSVDVPSPRCNIQQQMSTVATPDGQTVNVYQTFAHFDPALTVLQKDRLTAGGVTYEVENITNPDATDIGVLRVLVTRAT